MAVYHGRKGKVYVSTTGTGDAVSVGKLTNWSLDMSTDTVETTGFNDANKNYVQGLKDTSGSLSGFWQDDVDTLFDASDSASGCQIYLYPSADAMSKYFYGPAWLSVSVTTGVSDAVKIDANFSANGNWGRK